ncbi:hypothetical protein BDN72DRAFT_366290 [Pluteus cervinus]|uniref:Uncharacterized protein n=1 Tax=Pluteus cervinus TaxID=181527 RepID=A0ACD3BEL4_9AGAR|nr:hypothetical protein BDN72DRAFT_366290 [Pluteus cervinus]
MNSGSTKTFPHSGNKHRHHRALYAQRRHSHRIVEPTELLVDMPPECRKGAPGCHRVLVRFLGYHADAGARFSSVDNPDESHPGYSTSAITSPKSRTPNRSNPYTVGDNEVSLPQSSASFLRVSWKTAEDLPRAFVSGMLSIATPNVTRDTSFPFVDDERERLSPTWRGDSPTPPEDVQDPTLCIPSYYSQTPSCPDLDDSTHSTVHQLCQIPLRPHDKLRRVCFPDDRLSLFSVSMYGSLDLIDFDPLRFARLLLKGYQ